MLRTILTLTTLFLMTSCLAGGLLPTQQQRGPLDALLDRIKALPGQAEKPFSMIVHFKVKRDQVDAVLTGAKKVVPASRAEPGCLAYDVQQGLEDPTEFFVLETWRDAKGLEFHAGTGHFTEFIKIMGAAVDEAPQIQITHAVVPVGAQKAKN